MIDKASPLDEALALVEKLSPLDKVRLLEKLASTLESDLAETQKQPLESLYGLWADLKIDISEEDIAQVRREMWSNFPREDI
ncbi:MAG: hypothetical protein CL610_12665 [Anaerolineaceae bacterium]|nr:hypothetical protein [Anaerolineaceae bacterium]